VNKTFMRETGPAEMILYTVDIRPYARTQIDIKLSLTQEDSELWFAFLLWCHVVPVLALAESIVQYSIVYTFTVRRSRI